jgi:cation-transporting ATPase 13A3/4/5
MLSIVTLLAVNIVALLAPPAPVSRWLDIMQLPFSGRMTLCAAVAVNMIASVAFEDWAVPAIAKLTGRWQKWYGQRRMREGKAYKIVEGGMGSGL